MRAVARVVSWLALAATIAPPLLFFADRMDLAQMKLWMLAATIVWYVATPIWMDRGQN